MSIYVDIDGVICNFVDRFLHFFKVSQSTLNQETCWPKGEYDLYKLTGHRAVELPPEEWAKMDPYPGALRMWNTIKSYGHILGVKVFPITIVPTESVKAIREKWVFDHLTTHPIVLVASSSRQLLKKSIFPTPTDILIDDYEKELENWPGPTILVPRPWNRADGDASHVIDMGLTRIRTSQRFR